MTAFASLPLKPALLASVEALGYADMTPVQAQSLPPMLEGRDVIAQAQTGSGKTAAFAVPTVLALARSGGRRRPGSPRALILVPTRELAAQKQR